MVWKVLEGGHNIMAKQLNALGDKILELYPLDKVEGRAHHVLVKIDGEIPAGIFHEDLGGDFRPEMAEADCSKFIEKINELKAENKELQDELANCLNAESEAKKECEECKKQMDIYIKENVALTKEVEKAEKNVEKFKEELTKVKAALKALE